MGKRIKQPSPHRSLFDPNGYVADDAELGVGLAGRQMLGYTAQQTRLCFKLLRAENGMAVSCEVLGDIGEHSPDGTVRLTESKSTKDANPVSNHAVDLWKTLANWVQTVNQCRLDPSRTRFELFVTKEVFGPLVQRFSDATEIEDARNALVEARDLLWGSAPDFPSRKSVAPELAPHLDIVFNALAEQKDIVLPIIVNFELVCSHVNPRVDLENELVRMSFLPKEVRTIADHLEGWVKSRIDDCLRDCNTAILERDEFAKEFRSFSRKLSQQLVLCSIAPAPDASQVDEHLPMDFVRQLELIEADDDDVLSAITQFFRASRDRVDWAESGEVHESSYDELEEILRRTWKSHRTIIGIEFNGKADVDMGKLLHAKCMTHQTKVQGLDPPAHFIPGSYHKLANTNKQSARKPPTIGWHPDFARLLGYKQASKSS